VRRISEENERRTREKSKYGGLVRGAKVNGAYEERE
jgi:hypothetical protein